MRADDGPGGRGRGGARGGGVSEVEVVADKERAHVPRSRRGQVAPRQARGRPPFWSGRHMLAVHRRRPSFGGPTKPADGVVSLLTRAH